MTRHEEDAIRTTLAAVSPPPTRSPYRAVSTTAILCHPQTTIVMTIHSLCGTHDRL